MRLLRNRVYYAVKPWVSPRARLAIRRWHSRRQRVRVGDVWPILPGSEAPPPNWPGWPKDKQFAVVLTHDVEGPLGLTRCRQLMELERRLGFRSSFNFIPEGPYQVPEDLRRELREGGFEVGVHDLHHDGKLYRDFRTFLKKAERINHYLKEWGAVGFRSGFMLHNLEWAHQLNVLYEASTFDTDPFEPQPDGVGTIFPFWVPRQARSAIKQTTSAQNGGYVELPYTLVQDSTLFLLLGERQPDIWLRKVDWLAKHGGMVLLNTHPDYEAMNGTLDTPWEYPVKLYEQLLEYIRSKYAGAYWQVTAAELARWYKGTLQFEPKRLADPKALGGSVQVQAEPDTSLEGSQSRRERAPRRICMISHSIYDADNRVIRYAQALAARGDSVDVFTLKLAPHQPASSSVDGVKVYRILYRDKEQQKRPSGYLLQILKFCLVAAARVGWRHWRAPYDLVHVHNLPDFVVYSALLPKWGGAKVILDIHDILPEFYASKFGSGPGSFSARFALRCERASARLADHVIISNHLWRDKYAARTGTERKCSVFINNVDTSMFRGVPRTRKDGKFIMLFPGGLQWHQGLDIAIRAFQKVCTQLPNAEFHIYGEGNMKESLKALVEELGLGTKVLFFPLVPLKQVPQIMANADLGVVPKRADSFGNEAYSTKIMEFMSLGVPVVASSTKIDRYYFDDSVVRFFESGNADALAEAILQVFRDSSLREKLIKNGLEYAARNGWESRKADYLGLVDSMLGKN